MNRVSALKIAVALITPMALGLGFTAAESTAQIQTYEQTDLTISSVLLPETTSQGAEFGSQTRVTIYNQGTTIVEGGFYVEMVISSDRQAPIQPAQPTSTFVEDGLLPNGRIQMPTIVPESTFTFTIPGMTMVNDAPLDELVFVCAVVDPEDNIDERWREYADGYGVNKLCMPIDVVQGSGNNNQPTPPANDPPSEEPPSDDPPSQTPPPSRDVNANAQLSDYDADESCTLNDTEFFNLVDDWTGEIASNSLFFEAIDAWMGQRDVCGAAALLSERLRIQSGPRGIEFRASQGATVLEVHIYDTSGREVFAYRGQRSQVMWNLQDMNNRPVANGVYFLRLGGSGDVRKLVVMR